jgi:hypothetical protein
MATGLSWARGTASAREIEKNMLSEMRIGIKRFRAVTESKVSKSVMAQF